MRKLKFKDITKTDGEIEIFTSKELGKMEKFLTTIIKSKLWQNKIFMS